MDLRDYRLACLSYVAGIFFFCMMDALMKALVAGNPVLMATFWRYIWAIPFTGMMWLGAGRPRIRADMLPVHLLRSAVTAAAAFLFFWSFTRLPLAEAVTFGFVAPLLVPPIAAIILKERIQARNLQAAALGFVGVLVATGLGDGEITSRRLEGVAAVLGSALAYAMSLVLMRARAASDGPAIVSLLGAAGPALILSPFLFMLPAGIAMPRLPDLGLFALVGLVGAIALQLMARAFARAEAQRLVPFEYSALIWASLIGFIIFDEPVAIRTLAGGAIIIIACLWQARTG